MSKKLEEIEEIKMSRKEKRKKRNQDKKEKRKEQINWLYYVVIGGISLAPTPLANKNRRTTRPT